MVHCALCLCAKALQQFSHFSDAFIFRYWIYLMTFNWNSKWKFEGAWIDSRTLVIIIIKNFSIQFLVWWATLDSIRMHHIKLNGYDLTSVCSFAKKKKCNQMNDTEHIVWNSNTCTNGITPHMPRFKFLCTFTNINTQGLENTNTEVQII